jgi:group I intron endonuclease
LDQATEKYNICLIAGSTLGRQHSEESKIKIGNASRGRKHSEETKNKFRGRAISAETIEKFKARRHSPEIRAKISAAGLGKIRSEESQERYRAAAILRESINLHYKAVRIIVTDLETNEKTEYKSISNAALSMGVSKNSLNYALKTHNPYRKRYLVENFTD